MAFYRTLTDTEMADRIAGGFLVGSFKGTDITVPTLVATGVAGQTAPLLSVVHSDGVARFVVGSGGVLTAVANMVLDNSSNLSSSNAVLSVTSLNAASRALLVKTGPASTADTAQFKDSNNATRVRIDKAGRLGLAINTAPADADVVNGEAMLYVDSTAGAPRLMIKMKDANGLVRNAPLTDGVQLAAALAGTAAVPLPRALVGEYLGWAEFTGFTNAALVSGKGAMHPIVLRADTYDAIMVNLAVLQAGGATVTKVAVYADNGNGSPLMDGTGPLAVGTIDLNAAATIGNVIGVFGTPLVWPGGRCWLALSYVETTAPTTRPSVAMVSGAVSQFPFGAAVSPTTRIRGRTRTGLTDMPADTTGWAISGSTDVPVMAIRRSA